MSIKSKELYIYIYIKKFKFRDTARIHVNYFQYTFLKLFLKIIT